MGMVVEVPAYVEYEFEKATDAILFKLMFG